MKQAFKSKTYYTKRVVNNILEVYDQSNDKSDWYQEANDFAWDLANKYLGGTENCHASVCGIIAALSPLKSWEENKKIAISFLKGDKVKHTKTMAGKAYAISKSDGQIDTIVGILNGLKITSFFLNIYNPKTSQAVTIDRHAISIAVGQIMTDNFSMTHKQYSFFQNAYRVAAEMRDVRPLQMQAVTWVTWRMMKDKNNQEFNLPF